MALDAIFFTTPLVFQGCGAWPRQLCISGQTTWTTLKCGDFTACGKGVHPMGRYFVGMAPEIVAFMEQVPSDPFSFLSLLFSVLPPLQNMYRWCWVVSFCNRELWQTNLRIPDKRSLCPSIANAQYKCQLYFVQFNKWSNVQNNVPPLPMMKGVFARKRHQYQQQRHESCVVEELNKSSVHCLVHSTNMTFNFQSVIISVSTPQNATQQCIRVCWALIGWSLVKMKDLKKF